MTEWNYSLLTHEAKLAGGPHAFTNKYINKGRAEMIPVVVLCSIVSPIITTKVKNYIRKRNITKREVIIEEDVKNVNIHNNDTRGTERDCKNKKC